MAGAVSNRVPKLLTYIHANFNKTLMVDELASVMHCSRWQIQRDFTNATGLSIAHYVRRLKLSKAAELLVDTNIRQLDIAMSCGFDSEISFHRSFKREYQCTPGQYRKRGLKTGMQLPIDLDYMVPLRIEQKEGFSLVGVSIEIHGVLSNKTDASDLVQCFWNGFFEKLTINDRNNSFKVLTKNQAPVLGVIDTQQKSGLLNYWAGVPDSAPLFEKLTEDGFKVVDVPTQNYLVITHRQSEYGCEADTLVNKVQWILNAWFPASNYLPNTSFDLETYPEEGVVEYWIPVSQRSMSYSYSSSF